MAAQCNVCESERSRARVYLLGSCMTRSILRTHIEDVRQSIDKRPYTPEFSHNICETLFNKFELRLSVCMVYIYAECK